MMRLLVSFFAPLDRRGGVFSQPERSGGPFLKRFQAVTVESVDVGQLELAYLPDIRPGV